MAGKIGSILAVCLGIVVFGQSVLAQETEEDKLSNALELGVLYYNFDYAEDIDGPGKSTEEGWLPGLHLGYRYEGADNGLYGRLLFEWTDWETNYDGTTQAPDYDPVEDQTENTMITVESNIGYTFKPGDLHITPYTGLGYRYWDRDLGNLGNPFSEEYSWWFVPLGVRADWLASEDLTIALDVSVNFMFAGNIAVNLSEADPLFDDEESDLGNKDGWKVELPVTYRFDEQWALVVTPWYEYSEIGKGDEFTVMYGGVPVGIGWEPASETEQYGVYLGIEFRF
ncbi:MAG: autotransporter domain-containing protein [Planctomycetota bacterium]|nr:autotransporter domain-containing protein [Planctomycetota bacterium]